MVISTIVVKKLITLLPLIFAPFNFRAPETTQKIKGIKFAHPDVQKLKVF